jgi:hypothetical protein
MSNLDNLLLANRIYQFIFLTIFGETAYMFTTAIFKRATMTAAVVTTVGLSSFVAARPSQAATLSLPLTFNNNQATAELKVGEETALSGSSPNITNDVINRLSSIQVSFGYLFTQGSTDKLQLSLNRGGKKTLITELAPTPINTDVNFDFTDLFKSNFAQFGEGTFALEYNLVGSDATSFARIDNAKLALTIPEPTTTIAGFVALALAAGKMQRKRKAVVSAIKVNS